MARRASPSDLIQSLKRFIQSQGDTDPSVCQHFTLNPSSLQVLGRLLPNKGHDEQDLEFIAHYLQGLHYLQITSNRPAVVDDKGGFLLQFFPSLLFLEIQRVKPHLILDCAKISDQLCSLTVHESLNSLEELLDNDIEQPPSWTHLRTLDCSHNNIPFIDASMQKAVQVRQLNLSHNLLRDINNLEQCFLLDELNLSYNHLSDLTDINAKLGNIRVLSLQNNQIKEIGGLEKLYSLERLDLSNNLISTANRVEGLGGLPNLHTLWVQGNPLTASETYRVDVYTAFGSRFEEVVVDGMPVTMTEEESIRSIQALSAVVKTPPMTKHSKRKKIRKRVIPTTAMKSTDGLEHYHSRPLATGEVQEASDYQQQVEELRESNPVSWLSKFKGEVVKNALAPPVDPKKTKKKPAKKKDPVWPSVLFYQPTDAFTLELCVERIVDGELEYQTLLLSEQGLSENELGTDENILTLKRSQLLFAQDHGADEFGNPTLLLAYLPSPPDAYSAVLTQEQWHEQPHRTVVYHLHNQEEIDELLETFQILCPRVVPRNPEPPSDRAPSPPSDPKPTIDQEPVSSEEEVEPPSTPPEENSQSTDSN